MGYSLDCMEQFVGYFCSCYATLIARVDNVVRVLRLQPMKVWVQNKPNQKWNETQR